MFIEKELALCLAGMGVEQRNQSPSGMYSLNKLYKLSSSKTWSQGPAQKQEDEWEDFFGSGGGGVEWSPLKQHKYPWADLLQETQPNG